MITKECCLAVEDRYEEKTGSTAGARSALTLADGGRWNLPQGEVPGPSASAIPARSSSISGRVTGVIFRSDLVQHDGDLTSVF